MQLLVAPAARLVVMDPLAFPKTGKTPPASFTEIHDHLKRAAANLTPSGTAEQTSTVVTLLFGNCGVMSLTPNQMQQLLTVSKHWWTAYPLRDINRHDTTTTRTTVLKSYIAGRLESVAARRSPYTTALFPVDL